MNHPGANSADGKGKGKDKGKHKGDKGDKTTPNPDPKATPKPAPKPKPKLMAKPKPEPKAKADKGSTATPLVGVKASTARANAARAAELPDIEEEQLLTSSMSHLGHVEPALEQGHFSNEAVLETTVTTPAEIDLAIRPEGRYPESHAWHPSTGTRTSSAAMAIETRSRANGRT